MCSPKSLDVPKTSLTRWTFWAEPDFTFGISSKKSDALDFLGRTRLYIQKKSHDFFPTAFECKELPKKSDVPKSPTGARQTFGAGRLNVKSSLTVNFDNNDATLLG